MTHPFSHVWAWALMSCGFRFWEFTCCSYTANWFLHLCLCSKPLENFTKFLISFLYLLMNFGVSCMLNLDHNMWKIFWFLIKCFVSILVQILMKISKGFFVKLWWSIFGIWYLLVECNYPLETCFKKYVFMFC
jgi:hypothetical protein